MLQAEPWLPPLASTGGQCSTAVPPACSAAHLAEALGLGCGSVSYIWSPGGRRQARWAEGCRAT